MEILIYFLFVFFTIFVVDFVFIKKVIFFKKRKKDYFENSYLKLKFKLKTSTLRKKNVILLTSIINAFIISLTVTVINMIDINLIFKFLIGFILLFSMIYALYEILGRYLKKKEGK